MNKKTVRMRRARKTRAKIQELKVLRLCVHRSLCHIYAQLIKPDGKVVAAASTLDPEVRKECLYGGNIKAAKLVGKVIAERGLAQGVKKIAFDRSGFKYHGRVSALAEAARENGLEF